MKNITGKFVKLMAFKTFLIGLTVLFGIGTTSAAESRSKAGMGSDHPTNLFNGVFTDFSVSFTNCAESIGVGLIPTGNAQQFVPAEFILAGADQPVTPLVVRTAQCSISINGHSSGVGEIVQVGAVIVPPDGTGDINNYTMFYYTTDLNLALHLLLAGVNAQFVPTIDYHRGNDGSFSVRVPLPGFPRFNLNGTVTPSPQPAGSFIANWWQKTARGKVKMKTNVPVIKIGGANLTLTTNPNLLLGQIIGGGTLGFPIIQQFNTFAAAQMKVNSLNP